MSKKKSVAKAKSGKYVYLFGKGKTDGNGGMKPLLGGKGANLAEMCRIGLPVPPGFTITTEVCTYYYDHKRTYPSALQAQMQAGVASIEKQTGKKFGDIKDPLLVSVRSGARDSMPGMMDTILNLGLNDQTVEALATKTGNARFAWDCYRRFVQMYGDVVLGVQKRPDEDHEPFEVVIETFKHERYHQDIEDTKLTADDLKELVSRFKALVKERVGQAISRRSPWDQLMGAVGAVFGSWMNDRAIVYRRKYNIPTEWGTAVNVQAMVYGNTGDKSGSGVAFTRNPANGDEGVLRRVPDQRAGRRRRRRRAHAGAGRAARRSSCRRRITSSSGSGRRSRSTSRTCRTSSSPSKTASRLHAPDAQRQAHRPWPRSSSRWTCARRSSSTGRPPSCATRRTSSISCWRRSSTWLKPRRPRSSRPACRPVPARRPARSIFNADRAVAAAERKEQVLLVRVETSPEDLRGMIAAEGILTARGGVSSHAALVARQMGKVCVCGAAALEVDYQARTVKVDGQTFKEGDWLSIDGTAGKGLCRPGRDRAVRDRGRR